MTNYNDGKIHGWNGGDCPVHPESVVEFWMRNGGVRNAVAGDLSWRHVGIAEIIAFRVVKQHIEPKTIWVNEYPDGRPRSYNSKHGATNAARDSATRIAVEFREVKK